MGDLYGVLGVPRSATHEQIKRAYRDLARRYHPDATSDPDAARSFDEVHDAYVRLTDAAARHAYDETLPSVSLAARTRSAPATVAPPPPRVEAPTHRWRLARALE